MITILSIVSALAVTFLIAMFLISVFNIRGGLLGAIAQLMVAFLAIEFYKLFSA